MGATEKIRSVMGATNRKRLGTSAVRDIIVEVTWDIIKS